MDNVKPPSDCQECNPTTQAMLELPWYYSIELSPGIFTPGLNFPNVVLTRDILKAIDVRDQTCLDIGTMEGLVPTLLKRRGAKYVAAYDRQDCRSQVEMVQEAYHVDFDYVCGMKLATLPDLMKTSGAHPFDLVVFAGVLYHMFDPLSGLALARGLVRNGGILLLETSAVIDKTMATYFNAEGRFYKFTNYFQASLACLDYWLRFLRLRALDCIYQPHRKDRKTGLRLCRVCIPCRAVDEPLALPGDEWMNKPFEDDFSEFLDWRELSSEAAEIPYQGAPRRLVFHKGIETVDIYRTVRKNREYPTDMSRLRLYLNDID